MDWIAGSMMRETAKWFMRRVKEAVGSKKKVIGCERGKGRSAWKSFPGRY